MCLVKLKDHQFTGRYGYKVVRRGSVSEYRSPYYSRLYCMNKWTESSKDRKRILVAGEPGKAYPSGLHVYTRFRDAAIRCCANNDVVLKCELRGKLAWGEEYTAHVAVVEDAKPIEEVNQHKIWLVHEQSRRRMRKHIAKMSAGMKLQASAA